MRVLHVNTTSHLGGAARAMRRFSQALIKKGHQSQFLVGRSKYPEDPDIHLIWNQVSEYRTLPNSLISRIGNQLEKYIGINSWSNRPNLRLPDTDLYKWSDIIDLRNLFGGYFNLWVLPLLTTGKPVVWRLPDMWAVTGHCSYPYDCERWKSGCHDCPLLTAQGRLKVEPPPTHWDGTKRVWRAKKALYQESQLHIIVTTEWMRDQVSQSILGNARSISVISNGVDLDVYQPINKKQARADLGLPLDEKILLWSAHRKGAYRKGFRVANEAMKILQNNNPFAPMFITMGSQERWNEPEMLSKYKHFGFVEEPENQALIYAAADAFLCTTLADGQPQTALESMACGTPVIAFDLGPMPEEVIDGRTGFIVQTQDPESLVVGIERFLDNFDRLPVLQTNCRQQALEKYDLDQQAEKYISLYSRILKEYPSINGQS